ncbi:hypothetical protein Cgig2_023604 [Carnegiea gigantea]|uniref:Uncharacterized protein n=1 Tax=Carnegiea gigantea TaxID=171969 RepID=A0A9Q1QGC2_9CARY|nr:hypothetical protein Cgig2_023604 [Carnegiea gigantea]
MGRKCSQCGKIGHNSRTCSKGKGVGRKIKLFGVQIDASSKLNSNLSSSAASSPPSLAAILNMKKSLSTGSLQSSSSSCSCSLPSTPSSSSNSHISSLEENLDKFVPGYVSDGRPQQKRKGVPWTEEEHKTFLRGLEKLGKGDWRGISREFVRTRTPTQVASHAQKYFLRQLHIHKFHKLTRSAFRPSVFDAVKSNYLAFEKAEDSKCKCKPSGHSIQFGLSSSPKTTSSMHNKHEFGEPLLSNIWEQDLKQSSPNEELNLELTLESGKGAKDSSKMPSSPCLISFAI